MIKVTEWGMYTRGRCGGSKIKTLLTERARAGDDEDEMLTNLFMMEKKT